MKIRSFIIITAAWPILIPLLFVRAAAAAEIAVVTADTAIPANYAISAQTVKDAFLGKPAELPDGRKLVAIDRKETPENLRARFYEQVIGRSVTEVKAYWCQIIFTGRGYPPSIQETVGGVKEALRSKPASIAFMDPKEVEPGFRVLGRFGTP